jgi:hypothetical protein
MVYRLFGAYTELFSLSITPNSHLFTMGKKLNGEFLEWPLNGQAASHVHDRATKELLFLWSAGMKKTGYAPLWGDEVEYAIVHLDNVARRATLSLTQSTVLGKIKEGKDQGGEFTTEFANYMVEGMPNTPYGPAIEDLVQVQGSMRKRYSRSGLSLIPYSDDLSGAVSLQRTFVLERPHSPCLSSRDLARQTQSTKP